MNGCRARCGATLACVAVSVQTHRVLACSVILMLHSVAPTRMRYLVDQRHRDGNGSDLVGVARRRASCNRLDPSVASGRHPRPRHMARSARRLSALGPYRPAKPLTASAYQRANAALLLHGCRSVPTGQRCSVRSALCATTPSRGCTSSCAASVCS